MPKIAGVAEILAADCDRPWLHAGCGAAKMVFLVGREEEERRDGEYGRIALTKGKSDD